MNELDARDRRHVEDVQRDDPAAVAEVATDDLRPAAGGRAEVDDDHSGLQQAIALDQLLELVRRARAHSFGLRTLHVRVVEMFLQPARAALAAGHRRTPSRGVDSGRHDTLRPLFAPSGSSWPPPSAMPRSVICAAWRTT